MQNIKKKVVVLIEEQDLELYLSRELANKNLKSIFSLILPGYPSNFTLSQTDCSGDKFPDRFCRIQNLSVNGFFPMDEESPKNLLQSICFENEISKKIKKIKEIEPIQLKTICESFSNPYVLFSFDNFMESSFNRIKSKNYIWSKDESSILKNCFYDFYSYVFNIFENNLNGKFKIIGKNFSKIFYILILFESLNLAKTVSRLEMFLRIFLKLCFLSIFSFFLNFNSEFLGAKEEKSNFSPRDSTYEKEISIIKTLLQGIIRSGNLCAI